MADPLFEKFGRTKRKGEIIFCEFEPGNTLFILQTGSVRITKIVANKEKTLAILPAGEIFGEMAILESAPRSATAIVEEDARMLELDRESFAQLVNAQPGIAVKLLRIFAQRISDQKRKLKIMALPDADSKVMDVFLMLAEKKGINTEEAREEDFAADVAEIANWAGISLPDAQKALATLSKGARLSITGPRSIKITNLSQFARVVVSKRTAQARDEQ